uniref:C2H2-type domain-containing protein n=2 Tax=Kalmanozyma brasiliensis (strain GHG001) TaxID=1365824 RepID=V5ETT8_KALBG
MSAGNNYHFETPSLHQVSALTAPFATSSPALQSGTTSPSLHEQSWNQASTRDLKMEPHSPNDTASTFQAPYAPKSATAASVYQGHPTHQAHYNEHNEYQGFGTHPGVSQYFQHRASISGPSMDTTSYAERYENAAPTAPAPPRVHGLAAWENASGSARPHTADGMFGQFGMVAPSSTHESPDNPSLTPTSSSRPYTSTSYAGSSVDPYYANRRMSMPDPSAGKVFSYMVPGGEDLNLAPQGYGSHYFGNGYHAGSSKKRPRRRYDEIERLYPCSWPGCTKSYGTLNHLNAHVAMQKHGPKRAPSEFKDMRKAWRKQKKEDEQRRSRPGTTAAAESRASFSGNSGNYASTGGSTEGGVLPTMGQSLAHLRGYSMSAPQGPFYVAQAEGMHANATPVQYATAEQGDPRLPYGAQQQQYGNLGAYLSAHRGSV